MNTKYENFENEQLLSECNELYNRFYELDKAFEKLIDTFDALEIIESIDRKDIDNVDFGVRCIDKYRSDVLQEIKVIKDEMVNRYFEMHPEDKSI